MNSAGKMCFSLNINVSIHNWTSKEYVPLDRSLGGESNREIDFGFGSCVRARALDVESERAPNFRRPSSLFPFRHWDSCLVPWGSLGVQVNPSETKGDQVGPSESQ